MSRISISGDSTANLVHGRIWMGGCPSPTAEVQSFFGGLVLCAREYQLSECFPGVELVLAPMDDCGSPMTREEAFTAVAAAAKVIRMAESGANVLVTCFAGRNRSGIVCALAMCCGPERCTPDIAIARIRAARGQGAFRNSYFESFLRAFVSRRG